MGTMPNRPEIDTFLLLFRFNFTKKMCWSIICISYNHNQQYAKWAPFSAYHLPIKVSEIKNSHRATEYWFSILSFPYPPPPFLQLVSLQNMCTKISHFCKQQKTFRMVFLPPYTFPISYYFLLRKKLVIAFSVYHEYIHFFWQMDYVQRG